MLENDAGNVAVMIDSGVSFKGGIEEFDGGSVSAAVDGVFEGNIKEHASGNLSTTGPGGFKGNSEHELPGSCSNLIADFQGTACNLL